MPLGGVGVLLGVWIGWWLAGGLVLAVMVPAAAVCLVGLVDDRVGLPPWLRLGAQLAIAGSAVAGGFVGSVTGLWGSLLGVALIVVSINAVNLFDGLDGLAGSAGLVASLALGTLAVLRGTEPILAWVLAAGLAGFLLLNHHPARVFLGDNGAYLVGFLLAVAVMRASPSGLGWQLTLAILLLGVFFVDLVVTIVRRGLARRPLFVGDRSHLYDRMVDRGWSVDQVVLTTVMVQLGFAGLGLVVATFGSG